MRVKRDSARKWLNHSVGCYYAVTTNHHHRPGPGPWDLPKEGCHPWLVAQRSPVLASCPHQGLGDGMNTAGHEVRLSQLQGQEGPPRGSPQPRAEVSPPDRPYPTATSRPRPGHAQSGGLCTSPSPHPVPSGCPELTIRPSEPRAGPTYPDLLCPCPQPPRCLPAPRPWVLGNAIIFLPR